MRRFGKHPKFVRPWRSKTRSLQILRYFLRRNRAPREVNFRLWKSVKRRFLQAKIFRQQRFRHVADPIGDTERAELGEITIIENQNELCRLVAKTFEHVRMTARKVPDVARIKVVRFSLSSRVDHRGAYATFQHERPFRSGCMPVKLAHDAGLKLHRHARDSLRDRQLLDSYFLPKTIPKNLPFRLFQFEFERRQFFPGQQRIRHVVLKTEITHDFIFLKRSTSSNQANLDFFPSTRKAMVPKARRAKGA